MLFRTIFMAEFKSWDTSNILLSTSNLDRTTTSYWSQVGDIWVDLISHVGLQNWSWYWPDVWSNRDCIVFKKTLLPQRTCLTYHMISLWTVMRRRKECFWEMKVEGNGREKWYVLLVFSNIPEGGKGNYYYLKDESIKKGLTTGMKILRVSADFRFFIN